jgi:hypothetical protein
MAAPRSALRVILTCAVGLAVAAAFVPCAEAGPGASIREVFTSRLGMHAHGPVIGRYETDEGGAFVFDRSTPRPLLKFDNDPEIWVLDGAPGPRGDMIYRNDLGEPMLRATRIGGMTVFTPRRPDGSPAALDGASPPLRLSALSPAALFTRFYQASVRASRAAQHQIGFETHDDAEPATAAAMADAAVVTCEALVDMAARPDAKRVLSRIIDVMIADGAKPNAVLQGRILTVTIVPTQGVFGRPSSRRIERAAGVR